MSCVFDFANPAPPFSSPVFRQVLSRQGERPMTFSAVVHGLIRKGELVSVQKGVNGVGGLGTVVSTMLSIISKGAVAASSLLWRNNEQNHLSRLLLLSYRLA